MLLVVCWTALAGQAQEKPRAGGNCLSLKSLLLLWPSRLNDLEIVVVLPVQWYLLASASLLF